MSRRSKIVRGTSSASVLAGGVSSSAQALAAQQAERVWELLKRRRGLESAGEEFPHLRVEISLQIRAIDAELEKYGVLA